MHKAVLWIQGVLIPFLGPVGLFIVAVFDSSFLSIPEVNDLLVVTTAASRPATAWMYVVAATLGSLLGCTILWTLGRRGGEALLRRRFGDEQVARTRSAFRKWDVLALAVPSMLPPPMPFKVFVLSAGVFGVPFPRFAATLVVARGARYTFWAVMGALYGARAIELLQEVDGWFRDNAPAVLGTLTVLVAVAALLYLRRRRAPPPAEGAS
ncbi:MAG TPA: VTT domain-containing protein [Vicinamibacteria bacterium]|nr:VTT domain-containing protein [Vicinamibacteria bacterium]